MFAELKRSITFVSLQRSRNNQKKITMNTFIPFIAQIDRTAKTLTVLKSAGDKAFGNPEAAIQFLGGLPDNAECISSGDYRQYKKAGFTITRNDLSNA